MGYVGGFYYKIPKPYSIYIGGLYLGQCRMKLIDFAALTHREEIEIIIVQYPCPPRKKQPEKLRIELFTNRH